MKLRLNFVLPFEFPLLKKIKPNSTILKIIKAFCIAFFISNSIYLSFFENILVEIFSPFLAIYGLVLLLRSDKFSYFWVGFWLGILWFWWIGLSSLYFNLDYLIPFEILGIALLYGVLFRLCHLLHFDLLRLAGIFCLSFIHILGFDWLNWGVLTTLGFFESELKGVICLFLIAYFYYEKYISRYYKMAIILGIFYIGLQTKQKEFQSLNLDYKLVQTHISQDQKYADTAHIIKHSDAIIDEVSKAVGENKELIIFPETSFVYDLKRGFKGEYYTLLKDLSRDITIIVGAFSNENSKTYNSTYIFAGEQVYTFNKHYLVPFGEEIPFFKDLVKKYLLPNMSEFARGEALSQYQLGEQLITNAICYEATKENLYKQSKIIIAISNNAWFDSFVEPSLQRLLIGFYASKYGVSVYHATNGNFTGVITPKYPLIKTLEQKAREFYEKAKSFF